MSLCFVLGKSEGLKQFMTLGTDSYRYGGIKNVKKQAPKECDCKVSPFQGFIQLLIRLPCTSYGVMNSLAPSEPVR
jgi:hypothetical protein